MTSLIDRWRARASELEPYAPAAAAAYRTAASELATEEFRLDNEKLKIAPAARECGFSAQHLRRMVREGRLRNYGKKNAPLVRRGDLPKRAAA